MADTANISDRFYTQSADLLALVGNSARLEILNHILDNETSVGTLCLELGLSQSATSQHLSKLRQAGLVNTRRHAQTIFYSSTSVNVRKILGLLDEMITG